MKKTIFPIRRPLALVLMGLVICALLHIGVSQEKPWWKKDGEARAKKRFPTRAAAFTFARKIEATPVGHGWPGRRWHHYLPPCPDRLTDLDLDEWEKDPDDIARIYHPGAVSYRSKRRYRSAFDDGQDETWHGQQATFRDGHLISDPADPGAGSPDFVGPTSWGTFKSGIHIYTGFLESTHFGTDVAPFEILGFRDYNLFWNPQRGENATFNVLVGRTETYVQMGSDFPVQLSPFVEGLHPTLKGRALEAAGWRDTLLNVRRGDVIQFESKGSVTWGWQGEQCEADGDPSTEGEVLPREIFAPRPFAKERIGALMGAIVPKNNLPTPNKMPGFKIGRSKNYTVAQDGRLFLGINDSKPNNNKGYFDVKVTKISR